MTYKRYSKKRIVHSVKTLTRLYRRLSKNTQKIKTYLMMLPI